MKDRLRFLAPYRFVQPVPRFQHRAGSAGSYLTDILCRKRVSLQGLFSDSSRTNRSAGKGSGRAGRIRPFGSGLSGTFRGRGRCHPKVFCAIVIADWPSTGITSRTTNP